MRRPYDPDEEDARELSRELDREYTAQRFNRPGPDGWAPADFVYSPPERGTG